MASHAESDRYHAEQYQKPYESTAALADFIRSLAGDTLTGDVHDVGCGAGSIIHWLDAWGITRGCDVLGIDGDPALIEIAQRNNPTHTFACLDFHHHLPACDYALSVQVLSFIEDWRPALRELLASTRRTVFISSLFWDGVGTHTHATDGEKVNAHYNVIERAAFTTTAERFGGRVLAWRPFVPSQPLHAPTGVLRSRTEGVLTLSGPLLMPWQMVAVGRA